MKAVGVWELKNQRPVFWAMTLSLVLSPRVRWGHAVPLPVRNFAPSPRVWVGAGVCAAARALPPPPPPPLVNEKGSCLRYLGGLTLAPHNPIAIYELKISFSQVLCCETFRKGPGCALGTGGAVGHPVSHHPAFHSC